jgi:hypothetical protein
MSSNRSLAVWCAPRAGAAPSAMEAHFNYWRIAGDEEFPPKSQKHGSGLP